MNDVTPALYYLRISSGTVRFQPHLWKVRNIVGCALQQEGLAKYGRGKGYGGASPQSVYTFFF